MSKEKCTNCDFKYETTIKKTWNQDYRSGQTIRQNNGSTEKAIFKCTLCGELKSVGMED